MQFYDDGVVQLDRAALTLRRYHFPSGTAKVIALDDIRGYKAEPLGLLTHRFRIWGSSDLQRWLPLDVNRPLKSTLITLDIPGRGGNLPSRPGARTISSHCWTSCSDSAVNPRRT
ncbi:hypothetical protein NIIDMKKI_77980 [Mycobacterium kansasii]|uniref:Uncharacterized protein n=1 Tax=Mycobacterium kansasii TaxID=1768 RepID=A0A7G1IQZ8_MYCKA|nr:hypothetical protein NIIDMKKI_77980 [Mycobacterium kansasii]